MKIFICTSKYLYNKIPPVNEALKKMGHQITLPNSYDNPFLEEEMKKKSTAAHIEFKTAMLREQEKKVLANDAILVLNYEKNGQPNYIGGATFLEIFKASELGKKIFLMNPIPDNIFKDELIGINPVVINQDLSKIIIN